MEAFYSSVGISLAAETKMRYGQQAGIQDEWKRIISIDSASERKKEIDKFVSAMESNCEKNGFYGREDSVKINQIGNEFRIDDNELYYMFFENLRILKQNHPTEDESRILFHGVLHTVKNYFGGFGANRNVRMALTSVDIEEDIIPSISAQKGRNQVSFLVCGSGGVAVGRAVSPLALLVASGRTFGAGKHERIEA